VSNDQPRKKSAQPTLRFKEELNAWVAWVRFPDGHKERVKRRDFDDATADLNEKLARRARQTERPERVTNGATFDDVVTAWLDAGCPTPRGRTIKGKAHRHNFAKSNNTIIQATDYLRNHVAPRRDLDTPEQAKRRNPSFKTNPKAVGALWIDKTATERIEAIFQEMADRGLSKAYIDKVFEHMNNAVAWGVGERMNKTNPVDACRLPIGKPKKKGKPFNFDEAKRFFEAVAADRREAFWLTGIYVGNRPGELIGLRWCYLDLDSERPTITIAERAHEEHKKYVGQRDPKTGREAAIELHPVAVAALKKHRDDMIALGLYEFDDTPYASRGFVFPTSNGTPYSQANVRRYLREVCKKAKVDVERTTYDLRRTFASIADEYVTRKEVGKVMGHSGPQAEKTTAGYISGVRASTDIARRAFDAFHEEAAS
jgi:integrase